MAMCAGKSVAPRVALLCDGDQLLSLVHAHRSNAQAFFRSGDAIPLAIRSLRVLHSDVYAFRTDFIIPRASRARLDRTGMSRMLQRPQTVTHLAHARVLVARAAMSDLALPA
jgi:hypothetical protein